jgi:hypothetical protein
VNPALILQFLPVAISIVDNLTTWIGNITTDLKQNAELTPEQSAQLDQHITTIEAKPWWQPQQ